MKKKFLYALFLLPNLLFASEGYNHKAQLDSVNIKGFYKILLTPEIISVLQPNYADIRLYDSKNNEIPYLFVEEKPVTITSFFREIKVLENIPIYKPKLSRIVIHNINRKVLSELLLIIRSTDAKREITIKGSDDQKNWYFISKSYLTHVMELENGISEIRSFSFSKSNYEYLELTIRNSKYEPLQILKIGYYDSEKAKGLYTEIKVPKIFQKDTLKKSIITVVFEKPYEISKLEWIINGPEMYHRRCKFGNYNEYRRYGINGYYTEYEISSKTTPTWDITKIKTDTLILIVENADNMPLKVTGLKAFQINKYLVTQLLPDEKYNLYFGNKKSIAPEYDLKYFSDLIPAKLTIINPLHIEKIPEDQIKPIIKTKPIFNKTIMWSIIIIVALALGLLSIKLIREMEKT